MFFRTSILAAVFLVIAFVNSSSASDQIPGKMPQGPVAIINATIHPVTGPVIEKGTLLFDQGEITGIGKEVKIPREAEKISGEKLHIYPGLFEAYSQIGLTEYSAVRASNDFRETGQLNPNVKAHVSVDPDSEIIPVTRSNGVLLTMTAPAGGLISGQSAILQLDGWTYEDLTLKPEAAMIVSIHSDDDKKRLVEFCDEARRYSAAMKSNAKIAHDLRLESMGAVVRGEQPIIVEADRWEDIVQAVTFADEQKIKLIIFGGYDAPKCAEILKKSDVPVIISAIHRTPLSIDDPYDQAFTLPRQLLDNGIRFCISGAERSSTWNARNLPYHAATAVAFGLSKEEAIRSITLYPAQILGIDDKVGSLEVGKDATFIMCDGDPLEATTQTESAWIAGRPVDLNNKQTKLYQKYSEKYN